MLVIKIHYGLGNQLFQYALGRSLSLRKGLEFCLDINFFSEFSDPEHPRVYQLNHFNIAGSIATNDLVTSFTNPGFIERQKRAIVNRLVPYYKRKIIYEFRQDFDENILRAPDNSYFLGFWQDERYFSAIGDTLREDLRFRHEAAGLNKTRLGEIAGTMSVSLHIRRGDYLTDSYAVNNLGVSDMDYYQRAIAHMGRELGSPVFYIFSDDPGWVRDNFKIDYPAVLIDHNSQENAFEDLRLMSNCRHHIIAKSSFSWWGAWLAGNKDKIVIMPETWWVKGPRMFLPEGWIAL